MFLLRLIWACAHALSAKRADLVAENPALRQQLIVVKPATVVRWHRQGFKYCWALRKTPGGFTFGLSASSFGPEIPR